MVKDESYFKLMYGKDWINEWHDFQNKKREKKEKQKLILSQYLEVPLNKIRDGKHSDSQYVYQTNFLYQVDQKHFTSQKFYTILTYGDFIKTLIYHISQRESSEIYMKEWFSEEEEYEVSLLVKMMDFYQDSEWHNENNIFSQKMIVKKLTDGENYIDGKELAEILTNDPYHFSENDIEDMFVQYLIEEKKILKEEYQISFVKYNDYYIIDGVIDIDDVNTGEDYSFDYC